MRAPAWMTAVAGCCLLSCAGCVVPIYSSGLYDDDVRYNSSDATEPSVQFGLSDTGPQIGGVTQFGVSSEPEAMRVAREYAAGSYGSASSSQDYSTNSSVLDRLATGNTRNTPGTPAANGGTPAQRKMVYGAKFQISTGNPADAIRKLIETVGQMGGYMESRDDNRVVCRVPARHFGQLVDRMPSFGTIDSQSIRNQDVTREYQDVKLRIETADSSRRRVVELLDRAEKIEDIIKLEEELRKLVELIERLQGQHRRLSEQVAYSRVEVRFSSNAHITKTGRKSGAQSPFTWINQVGVERVLRKFGSVRVQEPSIATATANLLIGSKLQAPNGFLLVKRDRHELKAITPDESKFWVRRFDVSRRASLDFWTAALKKHLVDNHGYKLLDEAKIQDTSGNQGTELWLEVFSNGRAYQYSVALFAERGSFWGTTSSLRVYEFLATPEAFARYFEAVRTAVAR